MENWRRHLSLLLSSVRIVLSLLWRSQPLWSWGRSPSSLFCVTVFPPEISWVKIVVPGFYLISLHLFLLWESSIAPCALGLAELAVVLLAFSLHLAKQQLGLLYPISSQRFSVLAWLSHWNCAYPTIPFVLYPKLLAKKKGKRRREKRKKR